MISRNIFEAPVDHKFPGHNVFCFIPHVNVRTYYMHTVTNFLWKKCDHFYKVNWQIFTRSMEISDNYILSQLFLTDPWKQCVNKRRFQILDFTKYFFGGSEFLHLPHYVEFHIDEFSRKQNEFNIYFVWFVLTFI